jgi:hypothetical protein
VTTPVDISTLSMSPSDGCYWNRFIISTSLRRVVELLGMPFRSYHGQVPPVVLFVGVWFLDVVVVSFVAIDCHVSCFVV